MAGSRRCCQPRVVSAVFGAVVALGGGPMYTVSMFTPQLRATLGLSQTSMFTVVAVGLVAMGAGFPNGRIADRFGTVPLGAWACMLAAVAFGGCWWVVGGTLSRAAPAATAPVLVALFACMGQGCNGCVVEALVPVKKNFSYTPWLGAITGAVKFCVPGGSLLTVALFVGWFQHDLRGFFLAQGAFTCATLVLATATVRIYPPDGSTGNASGGTGGTPKAGVAGALLRGSPAASRGSSSRLLHADSAAGKSASRSNGAVDAEQGVGPGVLPHEASGSSINRGDAVERGSSRSLLTYGTDRGDDANVRRRRAGSGVSVDSMASVSGWEYLSSGRFLALWTTYALTNGACTFCMSSVGAITVSLHGTATGQASCVVSLMACNAVGRLLAGRFFDRFPTLPCMAVFTASPVVLSGLMLLICFVATPKALLPVIGVVGFCFGFVNTASAVATSEFFGTTSFGTNYGFVSMAPGVGGLLFSILSGLLYDAQVQPGATKCYGRGCFRAALLVVAGALLVSAVVAGSLLRRQVRHRARQAAGGARK